MKKIKEIKDWIYNYVNCPTVSFWVFVLCDICFGTFTSSTLFIFFWACVFLHDDYLGYKHEKKIEEEQGGTEFWDSLVIEEEKHPL